MSGLSRNFLIGLAQLIFVAVVLFVTLATVKMLEKSQGSAVPINVDLAEHGILSVSVMQPPEFSYTPVLELNGAMQSTSNVSLAAQVNGKVVAVGAGFRPGGEVDKGDLLFQLERADYELALEAANAEIASAESSLAQLESEAVLAVQEWRDLYPDEVIPDLAAKRPQIAAAEAALDSAISAKNQAALSLQRTRVLAPANMLIETTHLSVGQFVASGQVVGVGLPLDGLEINAPISEAELTIISPIQGRDVLLSNGVDRPPVKGTIVRQAAGLNSTTRLGAVYVAPDDPNSFPIGAFVDVLIEGNEEPNAYSIPKSALSERGLVWVVSHGRLVSRRVIQIGETDDALIVRRFHTGEGLVVLPPVDVAAGTEVTIRGAKS